MSAAAIVFPGTARPLPTSDRRWKWTREQYHRLGAAGFFEGARVELIRGEIVEMSPINWPHQLAKIKVARLLQAAFAGTAWVNEQGPLPAAGSEPQPDVAVISGRPEDYADHPHTALLVVEVADTTLSDDTTTKAELYAAAGFPDYWVLDISNRQLHVFRDPAPLPANLDAVAYVTRLTLGSDESIVPLSAPNSSISVSDLLP